MKRYNCKLSRSMKQILCAAICIMMLLGFTACAKQEAASEEPFAPQQEARVEPFATQEETQAQAESVQPEEASQQTDAEPYVLAYAEVLRRIEEDWYRELGTEQSPDDPMHFVLGYIDDDDIPELLVGLTGKWDFAPVKLYTFSDGKAILLGEYGTSATIQYSEKSGVFLSTLAHMGELNTYFYKLQNGEVSDMASLEHVDFMEHYGFTIDGEEVTKEVFVARWDELTQGLSLRDLGWNDGWEPTDDTIKTFLEQPDVFVCTGEYSNWADAVKDSLA